MKLSYILPVYNVEKYIVNCLESLYAQNMEEDDFEVICIDDGSTDASLALINEFKNNHNNVIVKSVENGGQGRARNIGIKMARGQYLFYVDSDDYIARGVMNSLVEDAICTDVDMLYFDSKGAVDNSAIESDYCDLTANEILPGKEYFVKYFPGNSPCLFLIKKSFVVEKELYFEEGHYCEDGMHAILSTNKAGSITYRHVDVYRYVNRPNSTVTKKDPAHLKKVIADFCYAIHYIDEFAKEAINTDYRNKLINRRDSYIFFLQIRMMRAKLSKKERLQHIDKLKDVGCYPGSGLSKEYGKAMRFLSKLFLSDFVYNIACESYSIIR